MHSFGPTQTAESISGIKPTRIDGILVPLPEQFSTAAGVPDASIFTHRDGTYAIAFFSAPRFLDNWSATIYTSGDDQPGKYTLPGRAQYVTKLSPKWYSVMSR